MDFTIIFIKDNAVGEVVSTLNKTVASGQLGSLTVDSLTLQIPTTPAPTATTAATQPTTGQPRKSSTVSANAYLCV